MKKSAPILLSEAAKQLGIDGETLRQQIKNGALEGSRMGHFWVTTQEAVEAYRRDHLGRPGAKPKRRKRSHTPGVGGSEKGLEA